MTMALRGNPIVGPEPGTLFARIGLAVSYAVPILLIAFSLVGHAIRERSASFAFTAGLLFNTAATAGYLLSLGTHGAHSPTLHLGPPVQLNALVAAAYVLCWLAAIRLRARDPRPTPALLITQAMLPVSLLILVLVPTSVSLWWNAISTCGDLAAGHWLGWVSLAATFAAAIWLQRLGPASTWAALAAVASLISMTLALLGQPQLARLPCLVDRTHGCRRSAARRFQCQHDVALEVRRRTASLSALSCLLAGLIARRGAFQDPQGPWWSMALRAVTAAILAYAGGWAFRAAISLPGLCCR